MALKIQLRHDPSTTWTSVNPVLSSAELGVELDTGRFKAGDGVTAWNSLLYTDIQGATQTAPYRSFGDGGDGDVTISSGTTTLSQDMYYNNLTLSGTGKIDCNGFKIFVKNTLDLTNAGVAAIHANGADGGNASGSTGGAPGAITVTGTLGAQSPGTSGANGTTGNGAASAGVTQITGNGGVGNTSGTGGTGLGTTGGSGGAGNPPVSIIMRTYFTNFLRSLVVMGGGTGGRGGGSGGGDSVNTGGGGGGGGTAAGIVAIYANKILTGNSTAARAIQAIGGAGGNGGNASAGDCGGGGGGSGGGGGWIYLCYNEKSGPVVNLLSVNGGTGGVGGNGIGTGTGGGGGQGSEGGTINIIRVPTETGVVFNPVNDDIFIPETKIAVIANTTNTGKNGGIGGKREATL